MIAAGAPIPGLALYLYRLIKSSYQIDTKDWTGFTVTVDKDLVQKFPGLHGVRAVRVFQSNGRDVPAGWIGAEALA